MDPNKELTIVFIPRRSRIRPYKMAKSLKYTGKVKLILLCEESFYDKELFEGIFDEVHFFTKKNPLFRFKKAEKIYRKINERIGFGFSRMMSIIDEIKPDLIHCFAEPYNHIEFVLRHTDIPVIMSDGADFTGISKGIENLDKRTLRQEKYCFENVSGIIHKGPDFEIQYYKEQDYNIHCKDLTWIDYCDLDNICECHDQNGELNLVYTGNISSDPEEKYAYYIDFAKILAAQRIHFHIYPDPYQYRRAVEYFKLDKECNYFHFHKPLPYKMIAYEISKYDWGVWWHYPEGSRLSISKQKVAIGNKMFTYLEAGLPVIVGAHNGNGRIIIENQNLGLSLKANELEQIANKIQHINRLDVIKSINDYRTKNNLESMSIPLYRFYKKILGIQYE